MRTHPSLHKKSVSDNPVRPSVLFDTGHIPLIYCAAETEYPKTNFDRAYAKFLDLITTSCAKRCAIAVYHRSILRDLPPRAFDDSTTKLGTSQVILNGAELSLLTLTRFEFFVEGPIFAIYVNLPQFKELLELPSSGIVYLPWQRAQLETFSSTYKNSTLI